MKKGDDGRHREPAMRSPSAVSKRWPLPSSSFFMASTVVAFGTLTMKGGRFSSATPPSLLDRVFGDHVTPERLDDVILQVMGPGHHPVRVGIEVPLDEAVDVDQRDQFSRPRPWRESRRGVHEIRRQRGPLVVLNDADDHRAGVSADDGAACLEDDKRSCHNVK